MTQLEMTTSTVSAGSGISLDEALEEVDVGDSGLARILLGEGEHLVGHVKAVGDAGRADALGGEDDVDAAARPQVEHDVALVQLGHRGRVAAAEARQGGRVRKVTALVARVQRLAEGARRVVLAAGAAAAARPRSLCDGAGSLGVTLPNLLAELFGGFRAHRTTSGKVMRPASRADASGCREK